MTIYQNEVRDRRPQGMIGQLVAGDLQDVLRTLINKDPQAKQKDEITVDTAASDTDYTVTIQGVDITITSDASATKAEIADALAAEINATPIAAGRVQATSDGVDKITVEARVSGLAYTITESDANLSLASVTTAAEADPIGFGLALISGGYQSGEASEFCKLAASSKLTAQVITCDYTYVSGKRLVCQVIDKHTGAVYTGDIVQATDKATSTGLMVTELDAILPTNFVAAADAGAGDELLLTAEVAGLEFDVIWYSNDNPNVDPQVAYTTGPDYTTSILRGLRGVSLYTHDEEAATVGSSDPEYKPNAGVKAAEKAGVWVASDQTIAHGETVYLELGTTDTGQFFNTDSATRLALPHTMAKWLRDARTGDDIAALWVNFE